jgi:hypothetical protein
VSLRRTIPTFGPRLYLVLVGQCIRSYACVFRLVSVGVQRGLSQDNCIESWTDFGTENSSIPHNRHHSNVNILDLQSRLNQSD